MASSRLDARVLQLGSGHTYKDGAVNVDVTSATNPDVVHDLNCVPCPFSDSSFTEIYAFDVIEHLNDTLQIVQEIHRVAAADAVVRLTIPHFRATARSPTRRIGVISVCRHLIILRRRIRIPFIRHHGFAPRLDSSFFVHISSTRSLRDWRSGFQSSMKSAGRGSFLPGLSTLSSKSRSSGLTRGAALGAPDPLAAQTEDCA